MSDDIPFEPIHNVEKVDMDGWYEGRRITNFPSSTVFIFTGNRSTGKTSTIKNLIIRQDPEFEEVYIMSRDPECKEYEDVLQSSRAFILEDLEQLEKADRQTKKLVILEDLSFMNMKMDERDKMHGLVTHMVSHRNTSVMITCHDYMALDPLYRRMADVTVIFKQNDPTLVELTLRKAKFPKRLAERYLPLGQYDSLWVDDTPGSPAPYRLNGTQIIEL